MVAVLARLAAALALTVPLAAAAAAQLEQVRPTRDGHGARSP